MATLAPSPTNDPGEDVQEYVASLAENELDKQRVDEATEQPSGFGENYVPPDVEALASWTERVKAIPENEHLSDDTIEEYWFNRKDTRTPDQLPDKGAWVNAARPHNPRVSTEALERAWERKYAARFPRELKKTHASPVPSPDEGIGLWGTIGEGFKSAVRAVKATGATWRGDREYAERLAEKERDAPQSEALRDFYRYINERKKSLNDDPGFLQSVGIVGGGVAKETEGASHFLASQQGNMAVSLVPGLGGSILGRAAGKWAGKWASARTGAGVGARLGMALGPKGAAIGGALGGLTGFFLGNVAIETGHDVMRRAEDGLTDDEIKQARAYGMKKGAVISAVDAATFGAGKWLLGASRNAAEKSTRTVLQKAKVDVTDTAALMKAKQNPEIVAEVLEKGQKAVEGVGFLAKRMPVVGLGVALHTIGEGAGEYIGEAVASGNPDMLDAVLESFAGLGHSAIETLVATRLEPKKDAYTSIDAMIGLGDPHTGLETARARAKSYLDTSAEDVSQPLPEQLVESGTPKEARPEKLTDVQKTHDLADMIIAPEDFYTSMTDDVAAGLKKTFGGSDRESLTEAYKKKKEESGVEDFDEAVKQHLELEDGASVENDDAMEWYDKAAAKGHPDALFMLGLIHMEAHDPTKAKDSFTKAAEQGHVGAQRELAEMTISDKDQSENNKKEAKGILEGIAKGKDSKANLLLGDQAFSRAMLATGESAAEQGKAAMNYYNEAEKYGNSSEQLRARQHRDVMKSYQEGGKNVKEPALRRVFNKTLKGLSEAREALNKDGENQKLMLKEVIAAKKHWGVRLRLAKVRALKSSGPEGEAEISNDPDVKEAAETIERIEKRLKSIEAFSKGEAAKLKAKSAQQKDKSLGAARRERKNFLEGKLKKGGPRGAMMDSWRFGENLNNRMAIVSSKRTKGVVDAYEKAIQAGSKEALLELGEFYNSLLGRTGNPQEGWKVLKSPIKQIQEKDSEHANMAADLLTRYIAGASRVLDTLKANKILQELPKRQQDEEASSYVDTLTEDVGKEEAKRVVEEYEDLPLATGYAGQEEVETLAKADSAKAQMEQWKKDSASAMLTDSMEQLRQTMTEFGRTIRDAVTSVQQPTVDENKIGQENRQKEIAKSLREASVDEKAKIEQWKEGSASNKDMSMSGKFRRRIRGAFSPRKSDSTPGMGDSLSLFEWIRSQVTNKHFLMHGFVDKLQQFDRAIPDWKNPKFLEDASVSRVATETKKFMSGDVKNYRTELSKIENNPDLKAVMHDLNTILGKDATGRMVVTDSSSVMQNYALAMHVSKDNANITETSITDDQAKKIIEAVEGSTLEADARAALNVLRDIVRGNQDLRMQYGLISQEVVDAWNSRYPHYVPLKRVEHKGFKSDVPRKGGKGTVDSIIGALITERSSIIDRGERNQVIQAFALLLNGSPDKEIGVVTPAKKEEGTRGVVIPAEEAEMVLLDDLMEEEGTGGVVTPAKEEGGTGVVKFLSGGKKYAIVFNPSSDRAMLVANALVDADVKDLNWWSTLAMPITRWMAAINTQYSPVFGLVNLMRDVPFGLITLEATELKGNKLKILNQVRKILLGKGQGIFAQARARRRGKAPTGPVAELWQRFEEAGGPTGIKDTWWKTPEAHLKDLKKELTKTGIHSPNRRMLKSLKELINDYNLMMENAVRLATFEVATRKVEDGGLGASDAKGANLAKNVTINFNRKGQSSRVWGAYYSFFNAAAQGTEKVLETLFERKEVGQEQVKQNMLGTHERAFRDIRFSKAGKKTISVMVGLGALQPILLYVFGGFGEDDFPEWQKARHFIIPLPGTEKGYATYPLPLGFNVLFNVGRLGMESFLFQNPKENVWHFIEDTLDIVSPVGGTKGGLEFISPTVLDPFVQLKGNRDWTDRKIYREDYSELHPTPGHTRTIGHTSLIGDWVAFAVNRVTGGGEYKIGASSPTANQIDFLLKQAGGGPWREFARLGKMIEGSRVGRDIPEYHIPLYGRFIGDADSDANIRNRFYKEVERVNEHADIYQRMLEERDFKKARAYRLKHPDASAGLDTNKTVRFLGGLTKRSKELEEKSPVPTALIRAIDERKRRIWERYLDRMARRRETHATRNASP